MNAGRVKILFAVPTLSGGGAERVTITLLRGIDRERFEPHLMVRLARGAFVDEVPADVPVHELGVSRARYSPIAVAKIVRRLRPGAVLSILKEMNFAVLAARRFFPRGTRIIVREATIPSTSIGENIALGVFSKPYARALKIAYRSFYPSADAVVCQSKSMALDVEKNLAVPARKIKIIPNPVDTGLILEKSEETAEPFGRENHVVQIVVVGRFHKVKRFDMLAEAFAIAARERPDIRLTLIGDGPEAGRIRGIVKRNSIEDRVTLTGFIENPYPYIRSADMLALTSSVEGLPNVILEAVCLGTPVLSTDTAGGSPDIITHGVNGWLVEAHDAPALAKALLSGISKLNELDRAAIRNEAVLKYDVSVIIEKYAGVFTDAG
jgi:glycosyltransferase involved in cell wall biosynthesis